MVEQMAPRPTAELPSIPWGGESGKRSARARQGNSLSPSAGARVGVRSPLCRFVVYPSSLTLDLGLALWNRTGPTRAAARVRSSKTLVKMDRLTGSRLFYPRGVYP